MIIPFFEKIKYITDKKIISCVWIELKYLIIKYKLKNVVEEEKEVYFLFILKL